MDLQSGISDRCRPFSSGVSRESACPGCRRERHCSGARECARTQRLGQRSQRHRQRGQSARDTVAGHQPRAGTQRILTRWYLPNVPGAANRKDETHAVYGIPISPLGHPGGRQGERQAARPQDYKHLQGMLIDIRDARLSPPRPKPSVSGNRMGLPAQRPTSCCRCSGYRAPCTVIPETVTRCAIGDASESTKTQDRSIRQAPSLSYRVVMRRKCSSLEESSGMAF
jgi:hypothetical protein